MEDKTQMYVGTNFWCMEKKDVDMAIADLPKMEKEYENFFQKHGTVAV